ncbi:hypothetical protein C8Q78DRAFT_1122357 [Trametes maxima]|nr:hypothetical protein C8Q78DRAFT_1122357 [Trametes maxima]
MNRGCEEWTRELIKTARGRHATGTRLSNRKARTIRERKRGNASDGDRGGDGIRAARQSACAGSGADLGSDWGWRTVADVLVAGASVAREAHHRRSRGLGRLLYKSDRAPSPLQAFLRPSALRAPSFSPCFVSSASGGPSFRFHSLILGPSPESKTIARDLRRSLPSRSQVRPSLGSRLLNQVVLPLPAHPPPTYITLPLPPNMSPADNNTPSPPHTRAPISLTASAHAPPLARSSRSGALPSPYPPLAPRRAMHPLPFVPRPFPPPHSPAFPSSTSSTSSAVSRPTTGAGPRPLTALSSSLWIRTWLPRPPDLLWTSKRFAGWASTLQ